MIGLFGREMAKHASSIDDEWAMHIIKGTSSVPSHGSTGVAMPTFSLLPLAAPFFTTVWAATSAGFGHNVVPYINQVCHSRFLVSISMGGSNQSPSPFISTGTTQQSPCQTPRPPNATL